MDSHFSVQSCTIIGVDAIPVTVEVTIGAGLPGFVIVGLPDASVRDAQTRVRSALRASGYEMPSARIVVNLAPADVKKTGPGFDLPIAIAILCASGQLSPKLARGNLFVGELSLEGEVRSVRGLLPIALLARDSGLALTCASFETTDPNYIPCIDGCSYRFVRHLSCFRNGSFSEEYEYEAQQGVPSYDCDFADVAGHEMVKRALLIAAAGNHALLMNGSPGSGKTMLAKRLATILPPLSEQEAIESAIVYSVYGLPVAPLFAGQRPFRSPHHSASTAGLIGGGSVITPGEISLAHNGVLFLDELPEFSPRVLQCLRQPLEDETVTLVRAAGSVQFPAKFMLVGAANPCPCGFYGDQTHECTCTEGQIRSYQARIGGPLLDRFDMTVNVWRTDPSKVLSSGSGISSSELREKVVKAREFRKYRSVSGGFEETGQSKEQRLLLECSLSNKTRSRFEEMLRANHEGGRGTIRTLRLARTIADLDESMEVTLDHILEALNLRVRQS